MVKKQASMFDRVKDMGDDLSKLGRKTWLAGLGAVAMVEEQTTDLVDRLVSKGEDVEKKDANRVAKAFDQAVKRGEELRDRLGDGVQSTVSGVLHRAGVPDRDEIHTLIARVEQLTEKVQALSASR